MFHKRAEPSWTYFKNNILAIGSKNGNNNSFNKLSIYLSEPTLN